ncbi:hypothetical protein [Uliginosibacterium sp. TH139]|uniref:hypothetical protein n=1 Tax=Uliginosibacterium sp. TH139 TaxID=2067453 RepID=UPI000C7E0D20|nr:hypothetical protein [Uliginosibacterium sp. TH139]PLK47111.1 hypothetical protein C0V76_18835 [Uliginosibacterium sp. TH139]
MLAIALDFLPDVAGLRLLNRLPAELSDVEVAEYAFQRRRAARGSDSLPPHLLRLSGFALFGVQDGQFRLCSQASVDEAGLLGAFLDTCAAAPALACWSEVEARLDALRLRALQAGVGRDGAWPRLNACVPLAAELCRAEAPPALAEVARLAGLPLMRAADEEWQWQRVLAGDWLALQGQIELRALVAWLLQRRQQSLSGLIGQADREADEARLREWLQVQPAPHLQSFAMTWGQSTRR